MPSIDFSLRLRLISLYFLMSSNLIFPPVRAESQLTDGNSSPHSQKLCPQDLPQAIERVIDHPDLRRSRWGIEIQTLAGEQVYSLDGNKFFNPASTAKLLVSAAGLLEFGADYRLQTPIYSLGNPPVLDSLRIQGKGDPTISSQSLKTIVHQLQARGIEQIEHLIVDDRYFAPPAINPTWEWLDVHSYFATAATSTILNQNTVTLTLLPQQIGEPVKFFWSDRLAASQWQVINQATTGERDIEYAVEIDGELGKPQLKLRGELAVNEPADVWDLAVVDPAQYFLESWRLNLTQAGIRVNRGTVIDRQRSASTYFSDTELMVLEAPPMLEILKEINQASNNLYAEVLGKILAQKLDSQTPTEAIAESLQQIGIEPEEYVLVDASGLSRQNLVAPQTLVKLLQSMAVSDAKTVRAYRQSLAIAGASGTLKRRFINTPLQHHLWAKTGTLTGVGALAGYLNTPSGLSLTFSIIVNNSELENREIRQAIDAVVAIVNRLARCERSQTKKSS